MAQHPTVDWHLCELLHDAVRGLSGQQRIHAKGILVTLESGDDLLLAGSPNLSRPALLQTAATANCEVARLVWGRHIARDLFASEGMVTLGMPVAPEQVAWSEESGIVAPLESLSPVALLGARLDGALLRLAIRGVCPPNTTAVIDGDIELPPTVTPDGLTVTLVTETVPTSVSLCWDGGQSGPVIIAAISRLTAMARGNETAQRTPLDAIDYGDDTEILALLGQMADIAIFTPHDLDRVMHGRAVPSEQDEANEANGTAPLVELSDIDFDTVRQHPRARAYLYSSDGAFEAPRIQLWLDDVVRQFSSLREEQALRLLSLEDDEGNAERDVTGSAGSRPRWAPSRRVRLRVANRIRRCVRGMGDPRFWRLVPPEWMAKNYALFLGVLNILAERAADPRCYMLSNDEVATFAHDFLETFWGSDLRDGYWTSLTDDEAIAAGLILLDYQSDALTIATTSRLILRQDALGKAAPFVAARIVSALDAVGLLTEDTAERTLVYLRRAGTPPDDLLADFRATTHHFTWERYCTVLAVRYGVRRVSLEARGFQGGNTLVIQAVEAIEAHPRPLALLANWIATAHIHDPSRQIFQLIWNEEARLIYHVSLRTLSYGAKGADGKAVTDTLCEGVDSATFATWIGLAAPNTQRLQAAG